MTFTQSSSQELDDTLNTLREKIILPSYLPPEQRKKLYKLKYKKELELEPVTLHIDDQVVQFRHVDRLRDLPSAKAEVRKALNAMKTKSDFNNLPRLLEGICVHAKVQLPPQLFAKMVRRAAEHGRLPLIMEAIKVPKRSGFKLDAPQTINHLLFAIQKAAIDSNWDKKETTLALSRIQTVLGLLEGEPQHQPRGEALEVAKLRSVPFYRDPLYLGARLHVAAALAVKHQEGKDVGGYVAKYAQQVLKLWPEGTGVLDLHPASLYKEHRGYGLDELLDPSTFLWTTSPVLNGLRWAAQVVEPEISAQLLNRAKALEAEIAVVLAKPNLKPGTKGPVVYEQLFGETKQED